MPKTRGQANKKIAVRIEKKAKPDAAKHKVILKRSDQDAKLPANRRTEEEKIKFMRVGVICLMAVFFVLWIFNLKYQFKINSNNLSDNRASDFNWVQTKTELDQALGKIKDGLAQLKQAGQLVAARNTLPSEPQLTDEQMDLLKGKILDKASSTATSTINNF